MALFLPLQLKMPETMKYFLSRNDKNETIHVEILKPGVFSAELGNYKKTGNLSVVFDLSKRGCFYCCIVLFIPTRFFLTACVSKKIVSVIFEYLIDTQNHLT